MSFSSIRRAALLPLALGTVALASSNGAVAAPHITPACNASGLAIKAYGATFQTAAERAWLALCNGSVITYNDAGGGVTPPQAGSGRCVNLTVNHAPDSAISSFYDYVPYCGSDDPLTTAQWAQANTSGNVVNQVPVAVGADAIIYNPGSAAGCPSPFSLSANQVSGIFAGTITNFSQLGCTTGQAITRVVRNTVSGTTCILKTYLAKRNPQTWAASNQTDGCGSTVWPAGGSPIVSANGNGGLVSTVSGTAGGISYPDLASDTSATNTLINPVFQVKTAVQEVTGGGENPYLGSASAVGAANCPAIAATIPAHTTSPGWDAITLSDGPVGYPICGFTYAFIYTNCTASMSAHGATATAECDAAVDVLLTAISPAGQAAAAAKHYGTLPQDAVVKAQAGLAAIL